MIIAAFGNVYGNFPALSAVLSQVSEEGIQTMFNTGNSVVGYPWPNEVIGLLTKYYVVSVQGSLDKSAMRFLRKNNSLRAKSDPSTFEHLQFTFDALQSANIEFLSGLPKHRTDNIELIDIFLCHGAPSNHACALTKNTSKERFRREREFANCSLIIHGKTEEQFVERVHDAMFVSPGSVGAVHQKKGVAQYAIINTEEEPWSVEFREADYDFDEVEQKLRQCGLDLPRTDA